MANEPSVRFSEMQCASCYGAKGRMEAVSPGDHPWPKDQNAARIWFVELDLPRTKAHSLIVSIYAFLHGNYRALNVSPVVPLIALPFQSFL